MSQASGSKNPGALRVRPVVVIIRDGWGYNGVPEQASMDATRMAHTPVDDRLRAQYPHTLVNTCGEDVGLPAGTMGNSEVGHQNIGAGRIVNQESMRLTAAVRDGSFFKNEELLKAVDYARKHNGKLHLIGLISDAGVHSLLVHLYGLLELCKRNSFPRVFLHALTDGRDTPPTSGKEYLEQVEAKMKEMGVGQVASVMGRFYGMDRDNRWDRVEKAYNALCFGKGHKATSVGQTIQESYAKDVNDEFIEPTLMVGDNQQPLALIEDGDSVIFFNFRGDRPREITRAFVDDPFEHFNRGDKRQVYYVCMTQYDATIPAPVAFVKPPKMKNIVGHYWSDLGIKQFRCAETEKYAHVTFFFNDYTEPPFPGEERQIIPSPKVATYELKPEMSAAEVTEVVLERLVGNKFDVMVVNFANPDMVGHTGFMDAAIKAVETVDACVGRIVDKVQQMGGSVIITADHGNAELMVDPITGEPFTSHTTGVVPLILVDEGFKGCRLRDKGILADVMPTALEVMGLPIPAEMTGKSLIAKRD